MKTSRSMNNLEIARLLRSISAAYEVKGENRFKIIAYDRAATAVEHATSEVKDLWDDVKLTTLPGVGPAIASHLDELFRKGKVGHFRQVMKGLPPAMFEMLNLPGVGAKTAFKLCQALGIKNAETALAQLEKASQEGKIALIEGFGEKSQAEILEALEYFKKSKAKESRMTLPHALSLAQKFIDYLEENKVGERIDPLGSLRRMASTVGDVDIAMATSEPKKAIECFIKMPEVKKVVSAGSKIATVVHKSSREIDLMTMSPDAYGALLQHFTGSKHHNIHLREIALEKGWSLSQYGARRFKGSGQGFKGLKVQKFKNEEDFYRFLGMKWIPPELREDAGEIEAAQTGKLPKLVELKDIKGDLHVHSSFPCEESHDPGMDPIEVMISQAKKLGWEYLGFTEHNPSLSKHTNTEIIDLIKDKKDAIDKINTSRTKKLLKRIFNGLEIDIKPNGELAVSEKGLELLDYGIASIHSSFKMPSREMTERVLRGLAHPKIKIFGHPSGRILGHREGYELDWDQVFAFCKKHDKWLEINAFPDRLDLPDVLVREAVKNGVKMVINTDAHMAEHLGLTNYGVAVARRGWAEKEDIINTLGYGRIMEILSD